MQKIFFVSIEADEKGNDVLEITTIGKFYGCCTIDDVSEETKKFFNDEDEDILCCRIEDNSLYIFNIDENDKELEGGIYQRISKTNKNKILAL